MRKQKIIFTNEFHQDNPVVRLLVGEAAFKGKFAKGFGMMGFGGLLRLIVGFLFAPAGIPDRKLPVIHRSSY